jgi:cobalt transporter subunit CbtB
MNSNGRRWGGQGGTLEQHIRYLDSCHERSDALVAAFVAMALGIGLVFTIGFAHPSTIHNAAHDTRHALSFPCH